MTDEEMCFVADALLALCDEDPGEPIALEEELTLKFRLAKRRDWFATVLNLSRREDDDLLSNEFRQVFRIAKLTPIQAEVLDLRMSGLSFDTIGRHRLSSKQGAQNVFLQAIKKIWRVWRVYPYAGLSDVYRNELRRGSNLGTFGRMCGKGAMRPSR